MSCLLASSSAALSFAFSSSSLEPLSWAAATGTLGSSRPTSLQCTSTPRPPRGKPLQSSWYSSMLAPTSSKVLPSLLNNLHVCFPNALRVVHDRMPERESESAEEAQDPVHLVHVDEATALRQEGTVAHARRNSVSVEHTRWELVSWRPCVPISMRPALVRLPEVAIFRLHIGVHRHAHDEVTFLAEFLILGTKCSKLRVNESWANLLEQLEK